VLAPALPPLEIERPDRPPRHPVRAVLMTTLAFGINVAWYWWDAEFNSPDWDLGWDWESWRKKVTFEVVRLDSNRFSTNAGSHTEGGAICYLIGRGNGLGPGASALLAFGEVVLWEFVGEFYEKPSVNDLFINTMGGLAVGEPFHQLSEFFARGSDNGVNPTLALIFSPISALNAWADGYHPRRASRLDRLGLPADVRHRFDLYAGLANARWNNGSERSETLLGARTRLNTVPGFSRPTPRTAWFGTGRITSIDAGLALTGNGMTGGLFATRVALAGYLTQNLRLDLDNRIVGQSLLLTLTNTFDYSNRRRPGLPFDQIASFAVAGPTIDLAHRDGDFEAALRLDALPSLAMITSLPTETYHGRHGRDGLTTVLANQGYYYGYGLGVGGQLALRYQVLSAGVDTHFETYRAIEGLDRFQERLTHEVTQRDGRLRSMAWLNVRPLRGYADIGVAVERISRWGSIGDVHASQVERRAMLTLGFSL
jgi:hypothetical protein